MEQLTEEQRQRVVRMIDEWEQVRAGATALRIIGEIIKWTLGLIIAVGAVMGISHTGK